jgi:4-carboxymuconolactone decarboxylase
MTDFAELWGEMMTQGQKLARAFNPALETFTPKDFDKLWPTMPKEFLDMVWGNSLRPGGLDARTRLLVVIAGLTVLGAQAEPVFKATVRHAIEAGATRQEIAEVIWQMSMLGGLPAMGRAMQMVEEVFSETGEEQS